jgi:DNA-binding response OmpR family regulator
MDTSDIHILVVEDEVDLREAMVEALTEEGYKVSGAENGQVGLSMALDEHPDLILLDLMMPILDGQEMFRRLRSDEWGRDAKVIILTAMDDVNNIGLAHEAKPLDYFIKAHHSLDDLVKQIRLLILTSN